MSEREITRTQDTGVTKQDNSTRLRLKPARKFETSNKDIPCKFVLTQQQDITANYVDDSRFVVGTSMFENMLYNVVSILILYQTFRVLVKFVKNR